MISRLAHQVVVFAAARREVALATLLVLLLGAIAVRAPAYVSPSNIKNVVIDSSVLCILVVGQLLVMLTRGIDLSPAATLAFTGMVLAQLSQIDPSLPALAFLALGCGIGLSLGAINGALIAGVGIPPIICTLGTMVIYRGLIFILSKGAWVSAHDMSEPFKSFPLETWLGLPNIVAVALLVIALATAFLTVSATGRSVYAVGSNPVAATFSGLSVRRTSFMVYCFSGSIAGLCGYLWTARFAIAYTQAAEGREFAIVAACVIGGVSIAGGKGSVAGAVLGALFISVIETALPFIRVSPFLQTAIFGGVILMAVALNSRAERSKGRQILSRHDSGAVPVVAGTEERVR